PRGGALRDEHRDRAGQRTHAHRQLADRVSIRVHRERTVGADGYLARAKHLHAGLVHVLAAEYLWKDARQEPELADAFEYHHLEQAIVEQCVRGRAHTATVGLRVAGANCVGREAVALARRVELDLELGWAPGDQRAQCSVHVHEISQPRWRFVGDAVRFGVEP